MATPTITYSTPTDSTNATQMEITNPIGGGAVPSTAISQAVTKPRQAVINSKYTIKTPNSSAPQLLTSVPDVGTRGEPYQEPTYVTPTLDYKTDAGGNHMIQIQTGYPYETVDMLQLLNKI